MEEVHQSAKNRPITTLLYNSWRHIAEAVKIIVQEQYLNIQAYGRSVSNSQVAESA
jgi:hypothetical protein